MAKTLVEVLQEQGVILIESSDGRYVAHCPFHEGDREPSFTVYPNETYWCFGCSEWGNPVRFLVKKGMSAKDALEYVGVDDFIFPKAEKRAIKVKNVLKTGRFLYKITDQYHEYLLSQQGPQRYLEERGLLPETITKFRLGYTDGMVLNLRYAEEYEMANEVGLLSKNGYEALAHRITIPNIIEDEFVDFMMGRTVINDKVKYLGLRMPKPLCGFYDSRFSPILFIVEGNFDYLILRQWGYPAVVASGTHISKPNYALLRGKKIVYIPDNDDAGRKATNKLKAQIPDAVILDISGLGVKDIGELAPKPDSQESFRQLVEDLTWESFFGNADWMKASINTLNVSTQLPLT